MANARPSSLSKPDANQQPAKEAGEHSVSINSAGQMVKRDTIHTNAGPVIRERNVWPADYKVTTGKDT